MNPEKCVRRYEAAVECAHDNWRKTLRKQGTCSDYNSTGKSPVLANKHL